MDQPQPITRWIRQLKSGDVDAAQRLWEAYFQKMVQLARRRLEGTPRAAADEEDVALSAFRSFCVGAREGRFSRLIDSDSLWPLLVAITAHKSIDLIRRQNRRKRGGTGRAKSDGGDDGSDRADQPDVPRFQNAAVESVELDHLMSQEPTPEFAAEMSELLQRLLTRLDATGQGDLRKVALLKLEGYSSAEIAKELECAVRSVERRMVLITRIWEAEFQEQDQAE